MGVRLMLVWGAPSHRRPPCERRPARPAAPPVRRRRPSPLPAPRNPAGQGAEGRAKVGIKDNLVRYSVGVEDLEDIWDDLAQAFAQI
jgi:hypothetical protein